MVHEEEYWLENIILFQNKTNKTGINNKKSQKATKKQTSMAAGLVQVIRQEQVQSRKKTLGNSGRRGGKNGELSGKNN